MRFIPQSATVKVPAERFIPRDHQKRKARSEEHTSELQSQSNLVCRLLLEKKKRIHVLLGTSAQFDHRMLLSSSGDHWYVMPPLYRTVFFRVPIRLALMYIATGCDSTEMMR